jgi:hypothetical protein
MVCDYGGVADFRKTRTLKGSFRKEAFFSADRFGLLLFYLTFGERPNVKGKLYHGLVCL